MICHGAQLMVCLKCGEFYCVPAAVGPAIVYHAHCAVSLSRVQCAGSCSEVTRAVVVFNQGRGQLEVAYPED